jgi:hypothetical protein
MEQLRADRTWRATVLAAGPYFDAIDECEARCAREIQDGLKRLGAEPAGRAR